MISIEYFDKLSLVLQDFFSLVLEAPVINGDILSWVCILDLSLNLCFVLCCSSSFINQDFVLTFPKKWEKKYSSKTNVKTTIAQQNRTSWVTLLKIDYID